MRAMTIAIPVSMLLSLAAAAQEQGKTSTGLTPAPPASAAGTAVPQAPVGHRQPTQNTLPPAVRNEESKEATGRGAADQFGPVPKICRNC